VSAPQVHGAINCTGTLSQYYTVNNIVIISITVILKAILTTTTKALTIFTNTLSCPSDFEPAEAFLTVEL